MNEESSEHDSTQPERREWDKPELEVIPMREALSGGSFGTAPHDGPFGYS